MKEMSKEQALQIIEKTADQLKKGGFNLFLFASKPTGATVPGFAEQSIVAMLDANHTADLISSLVGYTLNDPQFMNILMCVHQQIYDLIEDAKKHEREEDE